MFTRLSGALLVVLALAIPGYALLSDTDISGLGWLVVVVCFPSGLLVLRRARRWNEPRYCPRCGAEVRRGLATCPRCGLNFDAPTWAAIGEEKLP